MAVWDKVPEAINNFVYLVTNATSFLHTCIFGCLVLRQRVVAGSSFLEYDSVRIFQFEYVIYVILLNVVTFGFWLI